MKIVPRRGRSEKVQRVRHSCQKVVEVLRRAQRPTTLESQHRRGEARQEDSGQRRVHVNMPSNRTTGVIRAHDLERDLEPLRKV